MITPGVILPEINRVDITRNSTLLKPVALTFSDYHMLLRMIEQIKVSATGLDAFLASKPVTRHFNLPNHSKQHMVVCGLSLHQGSTESRTIRSDGGVTLETSAFESLYGGQFALSTQLIKPNYLVILPPTQHSQHHSSFFRNLPPLFQVCQLPFPIRQKLRLQLLKYSPSPAGISSWKRNIH